MPLPNSQPLRIAFAELDREKWTAGTHYFKNLFAALKSLDFQQRPEIVLLGPDETQTDSNRSLEPYIDQLLGLPTPNFLQRQIGRIQKRLNIQIGPEPPLAAYLRAHQIDSLFVSCVEFGPKFGVPLLAWIPDFQHLHLPAMFPPEEIRIRNQQFSRIAEYANRVILSSQNALRDFERFAPRSTHKARVLSFVAQVPTNIYNSDPAWVCEHYHLPQRFIYLPNQFWKHKNHGAVVQALALVKAQHPEITVVCTGNLNDYRDPFYFAELLATISMKDLRNNLIVLGLVPHDQIFQLMRQSLAVLQPSLFEGWSTTVEEAKSVGKCVILSDIPVHREQNPPQAVFFDPHNPDALADCLARAFEENDPGPDYELEALAREQLPKRTREFAQSFIEIVQELVPV